MAENQDQNQNSQEDLNHLLKAYREKLVELQEAGKDLFQITKFDVTVHSADIKENYAEWEGKEVSIAGHMMSKRVMGKASFYNIQDLKGNIQSYVARDSIGEEEYRDLKKMNIGDIVGLRGTALTTKTGEILIHVTSVTLLPKSSQILPEKHHGPTDIDTRYCQRYMDLIMNEDVEKIFVMCLHIISCIRHCLDGQDLLEVEAPMLVSDAGGTAVRPFKTHYNALDEDVRLRVSLELRLRRLVIGGMERVYETGRAFRNEGLDTRHNPEFTLTELYQVYTDYHGMMDLTENIFHHAAQEVCGTTTAPYVDVEIDLGKPFKRLIMIDTIKKYTGIDSEEIKTTKKVKKLADEKGVHYEERHVRGDIINLSFKELVEEHLIQPMFIMNHPVEVPPLTKGKPDRPELVERFGLFTYARRMCDVYSELDGLIDQGECFKAQEAALVAGDEETNTTDEDFLDALEAGMPPAGGIGYGIDRLVMLFTNSPATRDVLLLPTMKSLGGTDDVKKVAVIENTESAPVKVSEPIDFSKVKIEPLFEEMVDFDTSAKSDYRAVKVKDCMVIPKSKELLQFTLDDGSGMDCTILSGIHEYYEPEELIGKTCIATVNLPPRKMMGIDSYGMLISAVHEEDGKEGLNPLMVSDWIPAGAKLY